MDKTARTYLNNFWSEDRNLQNKAYSYAMKVK